MATAEQNRSQATLPTATVFSGDAVPPIRQILPLLSTAVSFILSNIPVVVRSLVKLSSWVSYPLSLLSLLPAVQYALAPFTVLIQVVLDTFLFTPYNISLYLLDVFYPVYVFCGAACICAMMLGIFARILVRATTSILMNPSQLTRRRRKKL